jgi:glyoxylase-like metal-dependent hydrolase (beta-lactamase superfamily II)
VSRDAAAWVEAAPGVEVRRSSAYAMNSVVVRCDGGALLVDPGVFPLEVEDIARAVARAGEIGLCFTHSHWDHVLGRLYWPEAPLIAHRRFHEALERDLDQVRCQVRAVGDEFYLRWPGEVAPWVPNVRVGEERAWVWRGRRFVARHAPGHASDQLTLHLPGDRLLIAADMLSDLEIPVLEAGCEAYIETLTRIQALGDHGEVEIMVPGHGAVAHGWPEIEARIERDLAYLGELDRRLVAARARRRRLSEVVEECAAMDYLHKGGHPPMAEVHRQNVECAFRAMLEE